MAERILARIAALFLCLVLGVSATMAQDAPQPAEGAEPALPPARLAVEPPVVVQGDPAEIVVTLPDGIKASSIVLSPSEQQAPLMLLGEPQSGDSSIWRIPVRFLVPDVASIDGVVVEAVVGEGSASTLSTTAAAVTVNPPENAEGDPRGWTALMAAPFSWMRAAKKATKIAVVAAAVAVPLALLLMFLLRKKPQADAASATARTPLEELDSELVSLRTLAEYRAKGAEAHYTRLSMALRRYLEGTGQFAAVEMTDDEVVSQLRHRFAGTPAAPLLVPIFDAGSLAKFAKEAVTERDAHEHLQNATTFVALERERLRERIAAAGRAA